MHERVHLCQEHAIQGLSAETEIREVGSGLSLADTQTAAMGGFTLDDGYLRGVAADAQRGILLRPCRASSASISRKRCVPRTYRCRRCANTVYVTDKMKTFKELTLCCLAELRE